MKTQVRMDWRRAVKSKKVKVSKKIVIILALFLFLIVFVFYMTRFLAKTVETDDYGYPESTLLKESNGKHSYRESKELSHTFGCPSIPYDISVPGEVADYTESRMSLIYEDMGITLCESENTALDELKNRLCTYAMESIDIPDTEWVDVISDKGYVNGYLAEYHTGKAGITTKLSKTDCYAVMYSVDTESDKNLMICITCSNKDDLYTAKVLLDDIVFTLRSQEEAVEETEKEEVQTEDDKKESVEKPEPEETLDMMESTEAAPETGGTKGIPIAEKDFTIQVDKEYETGLYIVFRWINDMSQPITMYVIDPSGNQYEKDDKLSREGEWVFVIPDNEKGEYVIHGEATSSIYVNYYEAMGREQYYQVYRNVEPNTGEPARGIGE